MAAQSPLITVMQKAVEKAARSLAHDFGEVEQLQVSRKGPGDFVSQADIQAERLLRQELQRARPDYGFMMEESAEIPSKDGRHRWIIDPLDGTTNFLHGIPHFAISVALEKEGDLIAGVVHNPVTHENFWAERGAGAYLNDRRLRVSGRSDLTSAVIGTGMPFIGVGDHEAYLAKLAPVMAATSGVRRMGAAALDLAFVAAGRFDAYFEFGLKPWDVAAGMLLVREAGGFVTEINGAKGLITSPNFLAGSANMHGPMMKLLQNHPGLKR
jgi:myo-inositol-1(or 4)-monophosphatase